MTCLRTDLLQISVPCIIYLILEFMSTNNGNFQIVYMRNSSAFTYQVFVQLCVSSHELPSPRADKHMPDQASVYTSLFVMWQRLH